jgi:hypothetical protein
MLLFTGDFSFLVVDLLVRLKSWSLKNPFFLEPNAGVSTLPDFFLGGESSFVFSRFKSAGSNFFVD